MMQEDSGYLAQASYLCGNNQHKGQICHLRLNHSAYPPTTGY